MTTDPAAITQALRAAPAEAMPGGLLHLSLARADGTGAGRRRAAKERRAQ